MNKYLPKIHGTKECMLSRYAFPRYSNWLLSLLLSLQRLSSSLLSSQRKYAYLRWCLRKSCSLRWCLRKGFCFHCCLRKWNMPFFVAVSAKEFVAIFAKEICNICYMVAMKEIESREKRKWLRDWIRERDFMQIHGARGV